jgi:MerR family transcriptional regulator, copper efflux regulator
MSASEAREPPKEYLTVGEAARFLGVTATTLRNWDRSGKLKAHRHPINGYRLYRIRDLEKLLREIRGEDREL